MPRKKPGTVSPPAVVKQSEHLTRPIGAAGGIVAVDVVHHVPSVHPSEEGPWNHEADKIAWTDPVTGYGCIIRRSARHQNLCGYVSVPPGHPLFGRAPRTLIGMMIGVHGGLNYSAACEEDEPEDRSICHVAVSTGFESRVYASEGADRDDAWWFGFSCDHRTDLVPLDDRRTDNGNAPILGIDDPIYKTEAFVYAECVRLAAQLKAIEQNRDPQSADPGPTPIIRSNLEFKR